MRPHVLLFAAFVAAIGCECSSARANGTTTGGTPDAAPTTADPLELEAGTGTGSGVPSAIATTGVLYTTGAPAPQGPPVPDVNGHNAVSEIDGPAGSPPSEMDSGVGNAISEMDDPTPPQGDPISEMR
jgi:hypothetical protein